MSEGEATLGKEELRRFQPSLLKYNTYDRYGSINPASRFEP